MSNRPALPTIQKMKQFAKLDTRLCTVLLTLIWGCSAPAVSTLNEAADVLTEGTYNLGFEPQIVLGSPTGTTGVNGDVVFDYPLRSDSSLRAKLGTGSSSYDLAVGFKYIPFPDYQEQPAMGFKVEAESSSTGSTTANGFRLIPLASKSFEIKYGSLQPYGGISLNLMNSSSGGTSGFQLIAGSELRTPQLPRWTFTAELDLNASNSWSSISGSICYNFDQNSMSMKGK